VRSGCGDPTATPEVVVSGATWQNLRASPREATSERSRRSANSRRCRSTPSTSVRGAHPRQAAPPRARVNSAAGDACYRSFRIETFQLPPIADAWRTSCTQTRGPPLSRNAGRPSNPSPPGHCGSPRSGRTSSRGRLRAAPGSVPRPPPSAASRAVLGLRRGCRCELGQFSCRSTERIGSPWTKSRGRVV
jgi:hypothetical protein